MTSISIKNIDFTYPDGTKALENYQLNIKSGERVAIIGQNGAGKTTAVKLMNGLIKPSTGDVIVGDWNTKNYTTAQLSRKVGYVFQNPDDQIFNDDVYSEVEFGPKNLGLSKEEIQQNVDYAIDLTGIRKYIKENPYNLPYSTRKFVTIASVVAMNTDVVIMDEPTAGQDLIGFQRIGEIVRELESKGKTVITITHDMEFVANHFHRVIVMANRKIVKDAEVSNVFWDNDVLGEAMLRKPVMAQIAESLDLGGNILTQEKLVEALLVRYQLQK